MIPKYLGPFGKYYIIQCPNCSFNARIDKDQYHGRVSIDCPECDYHETHDMSKNIK